MIRFSKLKVTGFKSFVEPVDVLIEPGLTGIVGPNGCGKSNLAEALRWVMGETSARQMRGTEMDDVIFGGSGSRPPRNLAEVALFLDNAERTAPARFNDSDEIEIVRRIERGQGSGYRINGRDVRARDVQTLFSDMASGARSTALVSQGRVNALIAAKPVDRRSLLEEAAGIGGLHARRHEAAQRLKAAEANLERLGDILGTLGTQLQTLKRQARQAMRYRDLSDRIAATESVLLGRRWTQALAELDEAHAALGEWDRLVGTTAADAARLTTQLEEAQTALSPLRQAEAEASARFHRLHAAREQLDSEEARLGELLQEQRRRCEQSVQDLERESHRLEDAQSELDRLQAEREQLLEEKEQEVDAARQADAALASARAEVESREAELAALLEQAAAADAERASLMRRLTDMENRRRRLGERERELLLQIERTQAEQIDQSDLTTAEMEAEAAAEYVEENRLRLEDIGTRRQHIETRREESRLRLLELESALTRLDTEHETLSALLRKETGTEEEPLLLDAIIPQPGYEAAVGAGIGDDLAVPKNGAGPVRWKELPPFESAPPLPEGAHPLSQYVTAPTVLNRRFLNIGIVENPAQGEALHPLLQPGQRLVSREGDVWRWDGLVRSAAAPSAASVRLQNRARYRELSIQREDAAASLEEARLSSDELARAMAELAEEDRQTRLALGEAERELSQTQAILARLARQASEAGGRLETLRETLADLRLDLEETRSEEEEARLRLAERDEDGGAREQLARLRAETAESRTLLGDAQAVCERLSHQSAARDQRIAALDGALAQWRKRKETMDQHLQELKDRVIEARDDLLRLKALPQDIGERRAVLLEELAQADEEHQTAALSLAQAEEKAAALARALKAAETAAAEAREERIRREAHVAAAGQTCRTVSDQIRERFSCAPEDLLSRIGQTEAGTETGNELETPSASLSDLEVRLARLQRDREALGAVNLLAEKEAGELEEQIETLNAERDDLVAAIEKLNRAIAELNREGRQRLLDAFEKVDAKFQTLFTRLFGGGRAHLSLIDSADPLGAGLEINASPPGKRLQTLSLLSGGEQALTALALLFAVFLVNPAPICVLDEVDAPLDDANVDRFCSLAAEIAATSQTRFLIVTHHRMTMARMDRLFGVTMIERGVSQVVSVDLDKAISFNESEILL